MPRRAGRRSRVAGVGDIRVCLEEIQNPLGQAFDFVYWRKYMPKIKIDNELFKKAKMFAAEKGYSSVEEFIAHLIETTLISQEVDDNDEDVMKRLKGLGYIS